MRPIVLQTLTWGTVVAAVSSALWLAWADNRGEAARDRLSARRVTRTLPAAKLAVRPVAVVMPVATSTGAITAALPAVALNSVNAVNAVNALNAVGAGFQGTTVGIVVTTTEGR
jgi:hypothetical protein